MTGVTGGRSGSGAGEAGLARVTFGQTIGILARNGWRLAVLVAAIFLGLAAAVAAWRQPAAEGVYLTRGQPGWVRGFADPVVVNPTARLAAGRVTFARADFTLPNRKMSWVGTAEGTTSVTQDGGQTWREMGAAGRSPVESIFFLADGKRGWLTLADGTVWVSRDGGGQWQRTAGIVIATRFLQFEPSGTIGLAGDGEKKELSVTGNGGASWQQSPTPFVAVMAQLLADRKTIIALDPDRRLWRSPDLGATWVGLAMARADAPDSSQLRPDSYTFLPGDARYGWAIESNIMSATEDGGATWRETGRLPAGKWHDIHFDANRRTGWVGAQSGAGIGPFILTEDGGRNWAHVSARSLPGFSHIGADERGHIMAAGQEAVADVKADGGLSVFTLPGKGSGDTFFAFSTRRYWRAQYQDLAGKPAIEIEQTFDGGKTWSGVGAILLPVNPVKAGPRTLARPPALAALTVSPDGRTALLVVDRIVWRSMDAGQTWRQTGLREATDLVFADNLRVWSLAGGAIQVSADGGATWRSLPQPPSRLSGLQVSGDGAMAWSLMDDGADFRVVRTTYGGQYSLSSPVPRHVSALHFLEGGQQGWVVGQRGAVFHTGDGGATWTEQSSGISVQLNAVYARDKLHVWAAGAMGSVIYSGDGGKTWQRPASHRYPAPWVYAAILACIPMVFFALGGQPAPLPPGVESRGTSDRAISQFDEDCLKFGPLARGISRLLRNLNTQSPLSIAIVGKWGSGKSSLMQLICTDLRRYDLRPVWFNAWHHQGEESLLAALLEEIRKVGIPRGVKFENLRFRLRLLWRHIERFRGITLLTIATAIVLIVLICNGLSSEAGRDVFKAAVGDFRAYTECTHKPAGSGGCAIFVNTLAAMGMNPEIGVGMVAALGMTGCLFIVLAKGLTAIGVNPADLVATVRKGITLSRHPDKITFRHRFAEQFKDATNALAYPLVIVIDDLDRCHNPAVVLTIMEAINFLVASGRCYVLFGMDIERVKAALSLGLEKLATEFEALKPDVYDRLRPDERRRKQRQAYAQDYLEKLINIEVMIPDAPDLRPLMTHASAQAGRRTKGIGGHWKTALAVGLALCLCAAAGGIGRPLFTATPAEKAPLADHGMTAPVPSPEGDSGSGVASESAPPQIAEANVEPKAEIENGPTLGANVSYDLGPVIALVIVVAGVFLLTYRIYRARSRLAVVRDSASFQAALTAFIPSIQIARDTPRHIKRYSNRVRYLAMLQGADPDDRSVVAGLVDRFLGWLSSFSGQPDRPESEKAETVESSEALPAHRLAAMGAFYEVYGDTWESKLVAAEPTDQTRAFEASIATYKETLAGLDSTIEVEWPPSADEIARFRTALAGVRVG